MPSDCGDEVIETHHTDEQCAHCGGHLRTNGEADWCPDCSETCSGCEEPIGDEWVTTEGRAHPECAEQRYRRGGSSV